ncbi:MAG: replicative DNA helicase [Candidatus Shikimatogenerans bostrichidophilus]|nr:MAG: replicative DNA helicase [Candidatus Shikimatogenerans bostrichidophilus]
MVNRKSLEKVINILKSNYFYNKKNKIIFKYIKKIFYEYKRIDLSNLILYLKKDDKLNLIGGEYYISYIIQKLTSFYNIKKYVKILINKYILRKLIKLSINIINNNYNNYNNYDIIKLLDYIQIYIVNLSKKYVKNNIKNFKYLFIKTYKKIKNNYFEKKSLFIPSGFKKLDKIILGFQKSDLIIIASRPGMGKTSFALSLIKNLIEKNIGVGFFTLEMSNTQIIIRLISLMTNITYDKLKTFNLNKSEINYLKNNFKKFKNYNLFIDDSPTLSILDFKKKCKILINKNNVKIIIIDYLQLINIKNDNFKFFNREQEISIISRSIKYIAKELKISIIALSQLSRAVEIRGGYKIPLLSDLRESGAIEQDSDIVLLLYRPEYYGFKYWYNDNTLCSGEAEIIIAKHRNGKLGNIKLKFIKEIAMFKN